MFSGLDVTGRTAEKVGYGESLVLLLLVADGVDEALGLLGGNGKKLLDWVARLGAASIWGCAKE